MSSLASSNDSMPVTMSCMRKLRKICEQRKKAHGKTCIGQHARKGSERGEKGYRKNSYTNRYHWSARAQALSAGSERRKAGNVEVEETTNVMTGGNGHMVRAAKDLSLAQYSCAICMSRTLTACSTSEPSAAINVTVLQPEMSSKSEIFVQSSIDSIK